MDPGFQVTAILADSWTYPIISHFSDFLFMMFSQYGIVLPSPPKPQPSQLLEILSYLQAQLKGSLIHKALHKAAPIQATTTSSSE